MTFLPISINIVHKKILLVGGGKVAYQKLKGLLPFTNDITVLAPDIIDEINNYSNIIKITDGYKADYLTGFYLVYACTDNPDLNKKVLEDSENLGILCNRTDKAEASHFHSPALVENDQFWIAINSKKKNPKALLQFREKLRLFLNGMKE